MIRFFALTLGGVLVACTTGLAEELPVLPAGVKWEDVFNPPYKEVTEVPTDSPLRKMLFDQLRPEMPESAKFKGSLKVFRNWAFFSGDSVDAKGEPLKMGIDGNTDTVALWLRTGAWGWHLIDFNGGHSDAFYLDVYPVRYQAPIFGVEKCRSLPAGIKWDEINEPSFKKPTEVPIGTPLRKELFDLAKVRIISAHFSGSLKAYRNWAFFKGRMVDADGKAVPISPAGAEEIAVLWLRARDGWMMVDECRGSSSRQSLKVWHAQYNAPQELFEAK